MWILWPNEMRKIWSFIFIPTWGLFTVFSIHILLIKNSRTIQYLVTTIWVFKYYSKITNRLNTKCWNIQIIRSNSDLHHDFGLLILYFILETESFFLIWNYTLTSRVFLLLEQLIFSKHASIGIPVRSLLQVRQTSNCSCCSTNCKNCLMVFK